MAKIGIVMGSLYACGGEERVVSLMANIWAECHEVTIFTFEKREAEGYRRNNYFLSDKISVQRVYNVKDSLFSKVIKLLYFYTGLNSWKVTQKILKKVYYPDRLLNEWADRINNGKFDIVIGISGVYTMLLGYIRERISAKTISWEHSSYEGYFDTRKGYYRNREALYRECAAKLDACVVLNEDIQQKYKKNLNLETEVIYNPKSFSSKEKVSVEQKCMVTCGRIEREKGYDDLVTAFYNFSKDFPDWQLLIIGDGSQRQNIEELASGYGIADKVIITGYVNNVREQLMQGAMFIMTSRWEGFPMSITEALEMGLPVISYDIPAMKPLVTDGVEGMIVPAFDNKAMVDAMKAVASDLGVRRKMSEAALRKAELLSPECIAEKWFDLFEKVSQNTSEQRGELE